MRVLKLVLTAIGLSLVGLSLLAGFSAPSRAADDTFKLELCNKYGKVIGLSLINRVNPSSDKFVVHGWYAIEVNKCGQVELPRGEVGIFGFADAGNNQVKMWGGDQKVCVPLPSNKPRYNRVLTPNYRCQSGEITVGFGVIKVVDEPEISLDLN